MKVAIDARTLGSRPSGVGMYLNDFLKQLIKYKDTPSTPRAFVSGGRTRLSCVPSA